MPKRPAGNDDAESADPRKIPRAVVERLSLYARVLQALEFSGTEKVSSAELARRLGLNSAQVRKDLAFFGAFGVPGFGYPVAELKAEVRRILGKDREVRVVMVGVGNLGSALISYRGFLKQGFTMLWGFDTEPRAAAARARTDRPIFHLNELESRLDGAEVDIAVLAVPLEAAQEVANRLVRAGVKAILNFTPVRLELPEDVHARNVDLSLELENLSYYIR